MYTIKDLIIDMSISGELENVTIKKLHVLAWHVENTLIDYGILTTEQTKKIIIDKYNEIY